MPTGIRITFDNLERDAHRGFIRCEQKVDIRITEAKRR